MFTKNKDSIKIKKRPLRRFNNYLTVVVLALSTYMIIAPFLPYANYWWAELTDSTNGARYQGQLAKDVGNTNQALAPIPDENTLVVPGIHVDTKVIEGADISVLSVDGVWRRPLSSTPDKGSNTVIVAHRYSYSNPATFYHLDKVSVGDELAVYWNKQEYIYKVFDIGIVEPSQVEIEAPTDEPIVTLYTCTPVWTASHRLIVKAKLISDPTGKLLSTTGEETL